MLQSMILKREITNGIGIPEVGGHAGGKLWSFLRHMREFVVQIVLRFCINTTLRPFLMLDR